MTDDHLEQVRQRLIRERLEDGGWFAHGLDMITRLETAGFHRDDLCWYLPARILGPDTLTGSTLTGLPVYEASAGEPPSIGLRLPVCSKQRGCPAHIEPPIALEHLWDRWAKQHGITERNVQ